METDGTGALKRDRRDIPKIDPARCSGCGRCVAACPEKVITLETVRHHKTAVLQHSERCTSCGRCVKACPVAALLW
ncbi:MAG: 4Fe-4S dicluster domain-containing protein [Desulfuromonadaceae bacterium]